MSRPKPKGSAITWRRALIAVALGGAAFIPSCSEDPKRPRSVTPPKAEPTAPPAAPDGTPPSIKDDPYLGYTR